MDLGQIITSVILAAAIFVIVRWLVHWVVNNGLFARIYLKHVFPRLTIAAYERGDAALAEQHIYTAYLIQLSARRQADRERAVQYLNNLSATQELANRLIEALPRQQRLSVKTRMAELLRRTLADLEKSNRTAGPLMSRRIAAWSRAISIWFTELIVLILIGLWLPLESIGQFMLIGLVVFIVTFLPLRWLVQDKHRILTWAAIGIAGSLAALWAFSGVAHTGVDGTPRMSMEAYGYPGVEVMITYPGWLLADDIDTCLRKITVTVFGTPASQVGPIGILLGYERKTLILGGKGCVAISTSTSINTTNPVGEPAEFFVAPTDLNALSAKKVTITPLISSVAQGQQLVSARELAVTIQLEDPIWKIIRDLCKLGTGAATLPAFIWFVYEQSRKKR